MNRLPPIYNCTAQTPMPRDRDQVGQHWYHHGAARMAGAPECRKPGDTTTFECPNCGHQFTVTLKPAGSVGQAMKKAQAEIARGRIPRSVIAKGKTQ